MGQTDIEPAQFPRAPDHALHAALLESRQRWRDFVAMATDLAFETDADGHYSFLSPSPLLGWPVDLLLGTRAAALLLAPAELAGLDPFRPDAALRRRIWLRRADGGAACLALSVVPMFDTAGRPIGARGIGRDETEMARSEAMMSTALRRGKVTDHILLQMRHEVMAPRMMDATLDSTLHALGAEGAAVIDMVDAGGTRRVLHEAGQGLSAVLDGACALLAAAAPGASGTPEFATGPDGRRIAVCATLTRFGDHAGLVLWRAAGSRPWDTEEALLFESAAAIVRVILEHEVIQREMARQARTDPLTGLLNRRAFQEELARRLERLDREELPGTLIYVDLDRMKGLNDNFGHEKGDEALVRTAKLLRDITRPTDLVARLGGDEFAIWLDGADQFTAAERAEALRLAAPDALQVDTPAGPVSVTLSIGIASRAAGGPEDIDGLVRHADEAMYEVKRSGRGQWRVWHEAAP